MMKKPLETRYRVDKILENKPRPAPRYPSSQGVLNEERKRNEQLFKERDRKDDDYLGRLKDFRIDSLEAQGSQPTSEETKRKLPESRERRYPRLIGEPSKGKITPVRLSELFAKRLQDPDKWTDEKLAELYQLDKETLSSVLKYFSDFAVVQKRDYPRPQDDVSLIE